MVGSWSKRKGCDVLTTAWRKLRGVRLVHVGPVGDLPLPADDLFRHVDAVPQASLSKYYGEADVAALASHEEGLALVQAQALASGLPLVCTEHTGGADLAEVARAQDSVTITRAGDADGLAEALANALERRAAQGHLRAPRGDPRELSWRRAMERYEATVLTDL
jgi:glycosyltransferase involved in cell wall biosynthesis